MNIDGNIIVTTMSNTGDRKDHTFDMKSGTYTKDSIILKHYNDYYYCTMYSTVSEIGAIPVYEIIDLMDKTCLIHNSGIITDNSPILFVSHTSICLGSKVNMYNIA